MAEVAVRVPGLLTRFTDGHRSVPVRAETVSGCLEALLAAYPALEPHLHDGRGDLRTHLKLFHNGSELSLPDARTVAVTAGDEVVVLQAVSGGSTGRGRDAGRAGHTPG